MGNKSQSVDVNFSFFGLLTLTLIALGVSLYISGIEKTTSCQQHLYLVCIWCWKTGFSTIIFNILGPVKNIKRMITYLIGIGKTANISE